MKRCKTYMTILLAACVTLSSCLQDDHAVPVPDDEAVSFSISIPGELSVSTRGATIGEDAISNLQVLVFDHNGNMISRTQAVRIGTPGQYSVRLAATDPATPTAQKKRIIHLIGNYDWSGFSDRQNTGRHENDVVGNLSTSDGAVAYWQRLELAAGIHSAAFPSVIELVRNNAKVTVKDNMGVLANLKFTLGDYISRGTIAPFNSTYLKFREGSITESADGSLMPAEESGFVPAATCEKICYEKQNSLDKASMYAIVKGRYPGDSADSYYKIDIIQQGMQGLMDITRNHHYAIEITGVTGKGHPTLQDAVNSAASNNLLYSIVLKDYTAISDGRSGLTVETTIKTLVEAGKEFSISFAYIPDISDGIENNTNVSVTLEQDNSKPVIDTSTATIDKTAGKACYKARTAAIVPDYEVYTAFLTISATRAGVELRREIEIHLGKAFEFINVQVVPGRIPGSAGQPVEVRFTIPDNIRSSLFPIEVFITTHQLSPNKSFANIDNLSLDYRIPGEYRYKYMVWWHGGHTIHFETTAAATSESMKIESELFSPVTRPLAN